MSGLTARAATQSDLAVWDDFVRESANGTIFDMRAFMGYHGARFVDLEELVVVAKGSRVLAQLAFLRDATDRTAARAPYGGSFGGLVVADPPTFARATSIVATLKDYLKSRGVETLELRPPPTLLTPHTGELLEYSMLRSGAVTTPLEVTSVVRLDPSTAEKFPAQARCRNSVRRALKSGVTIRRFVTDRDFFPTLDATYKRHLSRPTHTAAELSDLGRRLPSDIHFHVAVLDGEPVAGACMFRVRPGVLLAFYLTQTQIGRTTQALTLLVHDLLGYYADQGYKFLDLGTSTVDLVPREGVFLFKETFGPVGVYRKKVTWLLDGQD